MIDDTGPRITALERRVAEIEARMVAQPIRATNSSGTPSLAEAMEALAAIVEADNIERKWKARAEAGDRVLEQVLLWWRSEEELSMSDIVEKIRAHLQKGTP